MRSGFAPVGPEWRNRDNGSEDSVREQVQLARADMLSFIGRGDLSGLRVIDIGCGHGVHKLTRIRTGHPPVDLECGPGIHSLAMIEAGASELVSMDCHSATIEATSRLRENAGSPAHWRIMQGSVLDSDFLAQLGQFDLVYCWGGLQHSGDVWTGLRNVAKLVAPTGLLHLALCDSDFYPQTPKFWTNLKRKYASASPLQKHLYEIWYLFTIILKCNPLRILPLARLLQGYGRTPYRRLHADIKNWLGGWPMEFTRIYEVIPELQRASLQLLRTNDAVGTMEYLFGGNSISSVQSHFPPLRLPHPVDWQVMTLRNAEDFAVLSPERPIYIYGSGNGGDIIHDAIVKIVGCTPAGFITTHKEGRHRGLSVSTIKNFADRAPANAQILIASCYFDAISITLAQHGIREFYNAYPYLL